jgi:hypothetical protein
LTAGPGRAAASSRNGSPLKSTSLLPLVTANCRLSYRATLGKSPGTGSATILLSPRADGNTMPSQFTTFVGLRLPTDIIAALQSRYGCSPGLAVAAAVRDLCRTHGLPTTPPRKPGKPRKVLTDVSNGAAKG